MRLFIATLTIALALSSSALARPAGPEPATDTQQGAVTTDNRAPDQQAPGPGALASDRKIVISKVHTPVAAAPTADAPAPDSDGGPATIVFVLLGLAAALVLLAAGYFGVRYRHRIAVEDDLAVQ